MSFRHRRHALNLEFTHRKEDHRDTVPSNLPSLRIPCSHIPTPATRTPHTHTPPTHPASTLPSLTHTHTHTHTHTPHTQPPRPTFSAPDAWLPSKKSWILKGVPEWAPDNTPYHSPVLGGKMEYLLDRDLQTEVILDRRPGGGKTWVTLDLGTSFDITQFRVYTSWSEGPRQTQLQFGYSGAGPWLEAGEFTVEGTDKRTPGREYDQKATVLHSFGRLTARYWRVLFNTSYGFTQEQDQAGPPVRVDFMKLVELAFFGMETTPINNYVHPNMMCAYPMTLNNENECVRPKPAEIAMLPG